MKCRLEFDSAVCINRFAQKFSAAQKFLDNEVLKDCDQYVPFRNGILAGSGVRGTLIGSGKVIYDSPYARAQYYNYPRKNHEHHDQACMQWFEKAKSINKEKWIAGVDKLVTK